MSSETGEETTLKNKHSEKKQMLESKNMLAEIFKKSKREEKINFPEEIK